MKYSSFFYVFSIALFVIGLFVTAWQLTNYSPNALVQSVQLILPFLIGIHACSIGRYFESRGQ